MFRIPGRGCGHPRPGEGGGADDDRGPVGGGCGSISPHGSFESCDDCASNPCSSCYVQPLAKLREDACRRGTCWRINADRIRDGANTGLSSQGAVQGLAELRTDKAGAHMGSTDYARMRVGIVLRGITSRMGGRKRKACAVEVRPDESLINSDGRPAADRDMEDTRGCDIEPDGEGTAGDFYRGRQTITATRRCRWEPILPGSAQPTRVAQRSVQEARAEANHEADRPRFSAGISSEALGTVTARALRDALNCERRASKLQQNKLQKTISILETQLRRKECDREQRVCAEFAEQIRMLEQIVDAEKAACKRLRSKLNRSPLVAEISELQRERDEAVKEATEARAHLAKAQSQIDSLQRETDLLQKDLSWQKQVSQRTEKKVKYRQFKLDAQKCELEEMKNEVCMSETISDERLSTIRRIAGRSGGRPITNRSDECLNKEGVTDAASRMCEVRMAKRMHEAMGTFGDDTSVSTGAVMSALVDSGFLPAVWESREVWSLRMEWLSEVSELLSIVWSADLTKTLRDRLLISYDKCDELRFSFSHYRVGNLLKPRPWVINPWTGERRNFPQPIRARSDWTPLIKEDVQKFGLRMDSRGIAERSLASTLNHQVARDMARGFLRPISEADVLRPAIGADATGVGKRSMMHVGTTIASNYKDGISVANEMNLCTIATSPTDDHWAGLDQTLARGYFAGAETTLPPDSIAAEFNSIKITKELFSADDDQRFKCHPVGCFDLAAARGIRGANGRAACHCACSTSAHLFSVPFVGSGTSWHEASSLLRKHELLKYRDMCTASHTPPIDWDYSKSPWRCPVQGCSCVFASEEQQRATVSEYFAQKSDRSTAGKKAFRHRAKAFSKLHPLSQGEFQPPILQLDMEDIIVDPLHALYLNLPKTLWKYAFGDRMVNEQRELVADYLMKIGCPLDIRAKADGRDANRKWFSGAVFQQFVEGNDTDNPGWMTNIQEILEIIFVKSPALMDTDASNEPTNASNAPTVTRNNTSRNGGGGSRKRKGGFSVVTVAPAATAIAAPNPAQLAPDENEQLAPDAQLRHKYGSHMDMVKLILAACKAFGLLYAEWRSPWTVCVPSPLPLLHTNAARVVIGT